MISSTVCLYLASGRTDGQSVAITWVAMLVIAGLVSAILGLAVTMTTFNAQPKPGEVAAATVF